MFIYRKMRIFKILTVSVLLLVSGASANAQNLGDLLKGIGGSGGVSDILGNVLEGVFTKSNLTVADLVGSYESQGPAVTFKSENLLQKAGGIAGAAAIESKLQPYYTKYGLTGMTLTIDKDGAYSMKIKSITLSGNIEKNEAEGTFEFNFKAAGIKLGKFTAYIEKSGSTLKLMFDATKLKNFISTVANLTGNTMAQTAGSLLDSYDGACIGFKMVSTSAQTGTSSQDAGTGVSNGLNTLKDILKKSN